MNDRNEHRQSRRIRSGIFWPLILISLGVIFLLRNTGVVSGDLLNSLLPFWPVIFILMGLDSIYRREGWVGATLIIALGVVFLLSNLGYLALGVWQVLIRLWPLFLVAAGLDLLVGRRSWLGSLFGLVLILAILIGSLWIIGGGVLSPRSVPTSQLEQALEGATQARVEINQDAGSLHLEDLIDSEMLLVASGPISEGLTFTKDYQIENGKATLLLRGSGEIGPIVNNKQYAYDYKVNSTIPLEIIVNQGAGEVDLVLTKINVSSLNVDQAVGQITVLLPASASLSGNIDGAIGQIKIIVPRDVGLKIFAGTALVAMQTPPDFQQTGDVHTSANFDQAKTQIELHVNLAIGSVIIEVE